MDRAEFLRLSAILATATNYPVAFAAPLNPKTDDANSARRSFSADEIAADFQELIEVVSDIHPNPFWSISRQQLQSAIDKIVNDARIKKRIPEDELFRSVAKIVIAFDDPHCWTFTPGWTPYLKSGGTFLPLNLHFDGLGARVAEPALVGMTVGAKVVAINGESMTSLIKSFRTLTGQADDPFGDDALGIFFARFCWYFKGWGAGSQKTFRVQSIVNGKLETNTLSVMTRAEKDAFEAAAAKSNALEYRLIAPSIGLLEFRVCIAPEKIRALAEPIFQQMRQDKVTRLIVDARTNTGGGDAAWITLLEFLTEKSFSGYRRTFYRISQRLKEMKGKEDFTMSFTEEAWAAKNGTEVEILRTTDELITPPNNPLRFDGKWCVLSGRGTFSSGMSFVCAVKAFKLATVIGQETGGRVRGFGQWQRVTLPNSKIEVAVSTKQFDGAVDVPYRRGVPPDIAVRPNPEAIPNTKQDATFQAALKYLG